MLKVGDTIKRADKEDMVNTMVKLATEGIETDFLYEKRRKEGIMACCYEN
jgi:hypothetical protein